MNTYSTGCSCGHEIEYEHDGPTTEKNIALALVECDSCNRFKIVQMRGEMARTLYKNTQRMQVEILKIFHEIGPPMSNRQMYYQLVARGVVKKNESGLNKVQLQMVNMRRWGSLPYAWVSDDSRSFFQVRQYSDLDSGLAHMHEYYRRDLWLSQKAHVEIWIEKRGLVSQLRPICDEFGVRIYPSGGFSSIAFAYNAAMELNRIDRPKFVYHMSDFDADGVDISRVLEKELRFHGADITFTRLGLNAQQIEQHGLQSACRDQKKTTKRYAGWLERFGPDQKACDLDALPPTALREMVHNAITQHIDPDEWQRLQAIEAEEKRTLELVRNNLQFIEN